MGKQLTRNEIEALAVFFGCSITSTAVWNAGVTYDIYIVHGDTRERVGNVPINNPIYMSWTASDWSHAFQRISGIRTADLWGRRAPTS